MKKIEVDAVFLVPFYEKDYSMLIEVIDSIKCFCHENYKIVCVNDCENKYRANEIDKIKNVTTFTPQKNENWPKNTFGSLFCKKYEAIEYILDMYSFDVLLCIDTDALITGENLISEIQNIFKKKLNVNIGLIGSYKIRADGKKRTRWQWALRIILFNFFLKFKKSNESYLWNKLLNKAKLNGYKLGEHILGGAFIFKYECIKKIVDLFPYSSIIQNKLYDLPIGDDVIFSIVTFAAGYRIGDVGNPGDPLAIAQKFVPIKKEDIKKKGVKLIHSTKKGLDGENYYTLIEYIKNQCKPSQTIR